MRSALALLAVAGSVLALDQWTKQLATRFLSGRPPVELIGDSLQLTYALNSGVAFSLGAGSRFPFWLFSVGAAVVILWLLARGKIAHRPQRVALALILGGALGNLVDRVTTGLVVDFIEVGIGRYRWPVFNVADSGVTVGVVLFILFGSRAPRPEAAPAGEAGEASLEPAGANSPSYSDHVANPAASGEPGGVGGADGPLPRDGAGGPVA